jgi:hypothetical protein
MNEEMTDDNYYTTPELVLFNGAPRSALELFHK